MKKNRILHWAICLGIALVLVVGEGFVNEMMVEKSPIYVYAPKDMEPAFIRVLEYSKLNQDYKIEMTEDPSKANILVEMGKEFDPEYTKIAYTPFVVAYSSHGRNINNMIKNGMLQEAFFDKNFKEINFIKVVEEVIGEGKWENLGVKDMGTIKVYYPAPGTKYYTDYYDFMLVTVNGGIYPKSESDLKKAMEQIALFESSNYTESVKDYSEKYTRTGGFMENILYLIPEKEAIDLVWRDYPGRIFYPTTTVYANYFVKADELGDKLVDTFDDQNTYLGNFYHCIEDNYYRNDLDNELGECKESLYDERDVYNVLHLDKDRIRPDFLKDKEEITSNDTKETGEILAN